jgi:hypothetical protein
MGRALFLLLVTKLKLLAFNPADVRADSPLRKKNMDADGYWLEHFKDLLSSLSKDRSSVWIRAVSSCK